MVEENDSNRFAKLAQPSSQSNNNDQKHGNRFGSSHTQNYGNNFKNANHSQQQRFNQPGHNSRQHSGGTGRQNRPQFSQQFQQKQPEIRPKIMSHEDSQASMTSTATMQNEKAFHQKETANQKPPSTTPTTFCFSNKNLKKSAKNEPEVKPIVMPNPSVPQNHYRGQIKPDNVSSEINKQPSKLYAPTKVSSHSSSNPTHGRPVRIPLQSKSGTNATAAVAIGSVDPYSKYDVEKSHTKTVRSDNILEIMNQKQKQRSSSTPNMNNNNSKNFAHEAPKDGTEGKSGHDLVKSMQKVSAQEIFKVCIENLPPNTTQLDIEKTILPDFAKLINEVKLDNSDGQFNGKAYVEVKNQDTLLALLNLNENFTVEGHTLSFKKAFDRKRSNSMHNNSQNDSYRRGSQGSNRGGSFSGHDSRNFSQSSRPNSARPSFNNTNSHQKQNFNRQGGNDSRSMNKLSDIRLN